MVNLGVMWLQCRRVFKLNCVWCFILRMAAGVQTNSKTLERQRAQIRGNGDVVNETTSTQGKEKAVYAAHSREREEET